jgi:GNAT superfamily N-acetyltransferase
MDIVVRRAGKPDAKSISRLNADIQSVHAAAFPDLFKPPSVDSQPPATITDLIRMPENVFFLAELEGEPVGYAYAEVIRRPETPWRLAQDMVYLHHISVRPAHRRKGIGEALLRAVRAAGEDHGITLLATDVWTFNEPARRFFARQGLAPYVEKLWSR